jgi:hypothetical protein
MAGPTSPRPSRSLPPEFEAVFVVSNAAVRDEVGRACEGLDVPCYGPTFDSRGLDG